MNDDWRFDATDAELRRRFDHAAGRDRHDADTVLDGLRPALRRARTRRQAAVGSLVATVILVAGGVAVAVAGGSGGGGSVPPAASTPGGGGSAVTSTTLAPTPGATAGESSGAHGVVGAPTSPGASASAGGGPAPSGTGAAGGGPGPSGGGVTTTVPSGPATHSYSSPGGSIVVVSSGGQISLVSSTPASGYAQEIHDNGPTRVEVRFSASDGTQWQVRVDLVDGTLVPEVTQSG